MTDKKTGFWGQSGNRIIVWIILFGIIISGMKVFLPEPYPQLHHKAMSAFGAEDYNTLLQLTIDSEKSYPDRYKMNQLGYFKALALNKLGEFSKSQEFLFSYEKETTGKIHEDSLRLKADNHLALHEPQLAAKLIVQIYKRDPLYSQKLLQEIQNILPKFDVHALLDPSKDQMGINILNAWKKNAKNVSSHTGIWKVGTTKAAMPMRGSIFFTIKNVKTVPQGETNQITGVIQSAVNLSKLGVRVTAFDARNLYLEENLCRITKIVKGAVNTFTCQIPDASKIGYLHFEEISFVK